MHQYSKALTASLYGKSYFQINMILAHSTVKPISAETLEDKNTEKVFLILDNGSSFSSVATNAIENI